MEVKITEKQDVEVLKDITCDICGASCKTQYGFEFMTLSANWGFCSDKDLQSWTAHICEKCVDEKFSFIKFNKVDVTNGYCL